MNVDVCVCVCVCVCVRVCASVCCCSRSCCCVPLSLCRTGDGLRPVFPVREDDDPDYVPVQLIDDDYSDDNEEAFMSEVEE